MNVLEFLVFGTLNLLEVFINLVVFGTLNLLEVLGHCGPLSVNLECGILIRDDDLWFLGTAMRYDQAMIL